jgi:hypothetical protein
MTPLMIHPHSGCPASVLSTRWLDEAQDYWRGKGNVGVHAGSAVRPAFAQDSDDGWVRSGFNQT